MIMPHDTWSVSIYEPLKFVPLPSPYHVNGIAKFCCQFKMQPSSSLLQPYQLFGYGPGEEVSEDDTYEHQENPLV